MKKGVLVKALFRKKKSVLLLLVIVILLSLTQVVSAILLTPQNIVLEDFSSTQEQVITIINDQFEPLACDISLDYLSSYLQEFVVFEPNRFILQPGEQKNVKAITSFPSDLSPQTHRLIIRPDASSQGNSTISFRPLGNKRSELELLNVVVDNISNESGDIIISLELKNKGNTVLFVTPTLQIKQNSLLVKEIVYPRPLILLVGESYPLTLRQDTSELEKGKYHISIRALYEDNEEEFFSEEKIVLYEVEKFVDENNNSSQGRNIIIGLIIGAFGSIALIWFKPKYRKNKHVHRKHDDGVQRPLRTIHEVKHEIHYLKKEVSLLTKEVSVLVDRAEQIKKSNK